MNIDSELETHLSTLRSQGFTCISNFTSKSHAFKLLESLPSSERVHDSSHSQFIYNLQNYNPSFYTTFTRSKLLSRILYDCLHDIWYQKVEPNYILRGLVARSSSSTPLKMHLDSFIPYKSKHIINLICILSLEPSNRSTGCTVVVPYTHLSGEWASQSSLESAIDINCQPGDLLLLDTRTWHGARVNISTSTRWSITATFSRWWIKQSYDMAMSAPDSLLRVLDQKEKSILGFCNRTPLDEYERINIQGGYELIPD
ncbi:phytanoyl-CoA dioxygenase family protein [Prochlorococcus sp. MIT 1303]|uniref:phytanoyl-CoA dioxygenase family protein n=1 Tax=Prochlorococcus sp. MIT 1303 TaxID=1723647 RepID=UPI0007BB68E8|nr:Phytanoyl-CoA dioxygenase (PhyH) [Prochlorococcus sp. MIT 1303]